MRPITTSEAVPAFLDDPGANVAAQLSWPEIVRDHRRSGATVHELINDILDFSKVEAGKLSLGQAHLELRPSLESLFRIAAVRAAEKGVVVQLHIDPGVPAILLADALRLNQVVHNLLSNAIKFTERRHTRGPTTGTTLAFHSRTRSGNVQCSIPAPALAAEVQNTVRRYFERR